MIKIPDTDSKIKNENYTFVPIDSLRQHEKINIKHLEELYSEIEKNRYIEPILVDAENLIVLDGHHRFNIIKKMGFEVIPVYLVDYKSPKIKVDSWREEIKVSKKEVIGRGISGNLFPPKTSRHIIDIKKDKISLSKLR